MRKVYLVCPGCMKVEESTQSQWYEAFIECNRYQYVMDEKGFPDRKMKNVISSDHATTEHFPCGFTTTEWTAGDFEVAIEDGKIVDVGDYWKNDMETLEEALEKAGILEAQ